MGRGEKVSRDDSEDSSNSDCSASSDDVSCASDDSYSLDYSSAGSISSYKSSSGKSGWLYALALVAIYFLVPVTMVIVAEQRPIPGAFLLTDLPSWFYYLWPVAIAMTVALSGLELLFVLFGAPTPALNFLIGVALPCIAFWLVVGIAIPFLSKFMND